MSQVLDVALRLRLENQLSGESNKAERDLKDLRRAADAMGSARSGDALERSLTGVEVGAKRARRAIGAISAEESKLKTATGTEVLQREAARLGRSFDQAQTRIREVKAAADRLKDAGGAEVLARKIGKIQRPGEAARRDLDALRRAADQLGAGTGVDVLRADIAAIEGVATRTGSEVDQLRKTLGRLGQDRGPEKLTRDLDRAGREADTLKRSVDRAMAPGAGGSGLSRDLQDVARSAGVARDRIRGVHTAEERLGSADGAKALRREAERLGASLARAERRAADVRAAAERLKDASGARVLERQVRSLERGSERASRDLAALKRAADTLGTSAGADTLRTDIAALGQGAKRTEAEIEKIRQATRRLGRDGGLKILSGDLGNAGRRADTLRGTLAQAAQTKTGLNGAGIAAGFLSNSATSAMTALTAFAAPAAILAGLSQVEQKFLDVDRAAGGVAMTAEMRDPQTRKAIVEQNKRFGTELGARQSEVAEARKVFAAAGFEKPAEQDVMLAPTLRAAVASGASAGTIASAGRAYLSTMGGKATELPQAYDMMAKGGKLGSFELEALARNLPQLGSQYAAAGGTGLQGLSELVALAQVAAKGSGSEDEAANNLTNYLSKLFSPETVSNFKEKRVNLPNLIKQARAKGQHPALAVLDEAQRVTRGDPFKMGELFGDQQVMAALRPLMQNRELLGSMQKEIFTSAGGTVEKDFGYFRKMPAGQRDAHRAQQEVSQITIGEAANPGAAFISRLYTGALGAAAGIAEGMIQKRAIDEIARKKLAGEALDTADEAAMADPQVKAAVEGQVNDAADRARPVKRSDEDREIRMMDEESAQTERAGRTLAERSREDLELQIEEQRAIIRNLSPEQLGHQDATRLLQNLEIKLDQINQTLKGMQAGVAEPISFRAPEDQARVWKTSLDGPEEIQSAYAGARPIMDGMAGVDRPTAAPFIERAVDAPDLPASVQEIPELRPIVRDAGNDVSRRVDNAPPDDEQPLPERSSPAHRAKAAVGSRPADPVQTAPPPAVVPTPLRRDPVQRGNTVERARAETNGVAPAPLLKATAGPGPAGPARTAPPPAGLPAPLWRDPAQRGKEVERARVETNGVAPAPGPKANATPRRSDPVQVAPAIVVPTLYRNDPDERSKAVRRLRVEMDAAAGEGMEAYRERLEREGRAAATLAGEISRDVAGNLAFRPADMEVGRVWTAAYHGGAELGLGRRGWHGAVPSEGAVGLGHTAPPAVRALGRSPDGEQSASLPTRRGPEPFMEREVATKNPGGASGEIYDVLAATGFSDPQAFALMGHMQQESGLDPKAWNAGEQAGGLLQWRGNRLANLQEFAASKGMDWQDRSTQAAFVAYEMEHDPYERERSERFRAAGTMEEASAALKDYVRFGDNSGGQRLDNARQFAGEFGAQRATRAVSGSTSTPETRQEAAARVGATRGGLAPVTYANAGATRNRPVTPELMESIQRGVSAVYGEGYRAEIYSGGQDRRGSGRRRVGSTRHDDHGEGGKAADVYVVGPDGKRVQGEELARLGQHWVATGQGGVGLEMRGGGIHLDEHKERAKHWNYAGQGGRYTRGQAAIMRRGLAGEPPAYVNPGALDQTAVAAATEPLTGYQGEYDERGWARRPGEERAVPVPQPKPNEAAVAPAAGRGRSGSGALTITQHIHGSGDPRIAAQRAQREQHRAIRMSEARAMHDTTVPIA